MRDTPSSKRRLAVAGITLCAMLAAGSAGGRPDRRVGPARWHHHHDHDPRRPSGLPAAPSCARTARPSRPRMRPPTSRRRSPPANAIHTFPYVWGGGHRSFTDTGYDCSGAVSYVLHAAGLLASPMPSGLWRAAGAPPARAAGSRSTRNASHAYMVVAGLRFDTSSGGDRLEPGHGPALAQEEAQGRSASPRKYYPGY